MNNLLLRVIEEGDWKSLRFTVYNFLEEKEYYQQNLAQMGYDNSYDDLECKTFELDNLIAKNFKNFIEKKLQNGKIVVAICVIDDKNYFTIVKPKNVDILSVLKID